MKKLVIGALLKLGIRPSSKCCNKRVVRKCEGWAVWKCSGCGADAGKSFG